MPAVSVLRTCGGSSGATHGLSPRAPGGGTWAKLKAGPQEQLWYLRSILEGMRAAGQDGVLLDEFALVVESIASLVESGADR